MTAVASKIESIVESLIQKNYKHILVKLIQNLPEREFWDLVCTRLNVPPAREIVYTEKIVEGRQYYTEDYIIEKLFLQLAGTRRTVVVQNQNNRKYMVITDYKYYNQAYELKKRIPIAKPAPAFVVNTSDLSARIIAELNVLDDPQIILKQAAGRIFENIDARQYHLNIAPKLKVWLSK
jgi:hypothetical protein